MIETFVEYIQNCQLIIVADSLDTYEKYLNYSNIKIVKGPDWDTDVCFKANMKYLCLEETNKFCSIDDIVVYMDADCFFTKKIDNTIFDDMSYGLNVNLGRNPDDTRFPHQITTKSHQDKILSLNPDETQKYYCFIERLLVFKADTNFCDFIIEWAKIYFYVDENQLSHGGETYDIQVAALKSNLQINDIHRHPISAYIFTKERDEFERSANL